MTMMMTMMVMMTMMMVMVMMMMMIIMIMIMIMDHIYIYILKVHQHGISKIRNLPQFRRRATSGLHRTGLTNVFLHRPTQRRISCMRSKRSQDRTERLQRCATMALSLRGEMRTTVA
jgi:hypothetical protein